MVFKSAFLGCGPRANGHADAYAHTSRGRPVACCDLDSDRLSEFSGKHRVPAQYSDVDEMLSKEQPDLVHLVTPPTLRVDLMRRLSEAGVPGVIVEKPICIGGDDYLALRDLAEASETRFAVNHQLRHHPRILDLLEYVRGGGIGNVRFIDASCLYPMSGQGVHVLDLMFAFGGYPEVETVFGASSGYDDLNGTHPGPRTAESLLTFTNGLRGALQAGDGAPMFDKEAPRWGHKRVAVYGTQGFVQWWMQGFEKSRPGGEAERGTHAYGDEDVLGQAGLTNAVFDWLEDEAKPSPTCLSTALDQWLVILAGYLSTVEARPVDLPFDPPADLLDRYRAFVGAA